MTIRVVTPPVAPIVQLSDAKQHLRVDADDTGQDAVISRLVAAATATIDAPDGWLNRSIGQQVLELVMCDFPGQYQQWAGGHCYGSTALRPAIHLPYPPIVEVQSVVYLDESGETQTLDPAAYELVDRLLMPIPGTFWPATRCVPNAVTVRFKVGYDVPPPAIVSAILLMTGTLYENREDVAAPPSGAAAALLQPYRLYV